MSPHQILNHLCWAVIVDDFQKPSRLPVSCCVAHPADVEVDKISYEDEELQA